MLTLDSYATRRRLYIAAGFLCYIAVFVILAVRSVSLESPLRLPDKNGIGGYAYLPSLAIDGDLDLQNQANAGLGETAPGWMVSGRYPIGVALTLAPPFLLAHGVSSTLHAITGHPELKPDGFTLIYQLFNVAAILAFWAMAMTLFDRMLVRRFGFRGATVCIAILLFWLGSYAFWYVVRAPFWAHVLSTAWLLIAVVIYERVLRDLEAKKVNHWLSLWVMAMTLAVLCRLTNVFMVPFAAYLLYRLAESGLWRHTLRCTPAFLAAIGLGVLQIAIWRVRIEGSIPSVPEAIGYESKEGFFWTDPVLFLPLFSSLQGLFFWSPLLLWSVFGLFWGTTRKGAIRDPLFRCWILSALILWYINASWYAWWFGDAFGARAFLELGGLFIVGLAYAIEQLAVIRPFARRMVLAAVTLSLVFGYGLMFAHATDLIATSRNDFMFDWERKFFDHRRTRTPISSYSPPVYDTPRSHS